MADKERLLTLQVEIPGGQHARYETDGQTGGLRLVEVFYPPERFPGDLCAAEGTLAAEDQPLGVLLLGNVSHPAGFRLDARLIGVLEMAYEGGQEQVLVAVAADDPHFSDVMSVRDLSELRRRQVSLTFQLDGAGPPGAVSWQEAAAAQVILQQARQAYRLAQAEGRVQQTLGPAWKPLSGTVVRRPESEAEPHTAAEQAFHTLPYRFQKYLSTYLGDDERILFGLLRPAMRSALEGSFWRGKRLEEAVFIISTHQVAEVAELMPPDRAGIRYGFIARCGLLERLQRATFRTLSRDVIGLALVWRGSRGTEQVIWEFPARQRQVLEEALALLQNWLPRPDDRRLQRATPPEAPEGPEPLVDPAANDPAGTHRLAAKLEEQLARALAPGEPVLARCLLPAWIKQRGAPSLLAVTPHRLLIVAEPGAPEYLCLDLPLHAITSFEFSSTLIRSYLKIMTPAGDEIEEQIIHFGKTLGAMDACYLALRQAAGVVASVEKFIINTRRTT